MLNVVMLSVVAFSKLIFHKFFLLICRRLDVVITVPRIRVSQSCISSFKLTEGVKIFSEVIVAITKAKKIGGFFQTLLFL